MPINTHIRYNLLISYKTLPKWMDEYWYRHEVYSYVLLKSANLKTQVEEDFPVMAEKYKTEEALKNKNLGDPVDEPPRYPSESAESL